MSNADYKTSRNLPITIGQVAAIYDQVSRYVHSFDAGKHI